MLQVTFEFYFAMKLGTIGQRGKTIFMSQKPVPL